MKIYWNISEKPVLLPGVLQQVRTLFPIGKNAIKLSVSASIICIFVCWSAGGHRLWPHALCSSILPPITRRVEAFTYIIPHFPPCIQNGYI